VYYSCSEKGGEKEKGKPGSLGSSGPWENRKKIRIGEGGNSEKMIKDTSRGRKGYQKTKPQRGGVIILIRFELPEGLLSDRRRREKGEDSVQRGKKGRRERKEGHTFRPKSQQHG